MISSIIRFDTEDQEEVKVETLLSPGGCRYHHFHFEEACTINYGVNGKEVCQKETDSYLKISQSLTVNGLFL